MASPPFANGQYNTMATHGNNSRLCATESASVSELEPEPESKANWGLWGCGAWHGNSGNNNNMLISVP